MKKLFVILPLVLVLLLSSLPVMAQEAKVTYWNGCQKTIAGTYMLDSMTALNCGVNCIPVWLGYYTPCAPVKGEALTSNCDGWYGIDVTTNNTVILMNDGNPVDYIKANLNAASWPQIATEFMKASGYGAEFMISEPILENVIPMDVTTYVPGAWVGKTPTEMVEVTVKGLLIIVEDIYDYVVINHHLMRPTGEVVFTTEAAFPKNNQLDAGRIPAEWINTDFVDVTYDPAQTVVKRMEDPSTILTNGSVTFLGWEVDMYYVAAKAPEGNEQVDGAKAPAAQAPAAPAAVPAPVQLPATGAADTTVLVLSSLALVVLGVFFKK